MGDRGNIAVQFNRDKSKRVWFYTHWSGCEMDSIIAAALARGKDRWRDDQYLARIIFCELVKDHPMDTVGFGIGVEPGDNGHAFRVVDVESQTVFQEGDTRKGFGILPAKESDLVPIPFAEFIEKHAETAEAVSQ